MSNFQKDVQLLTDLQELISDAERTANMPGYAGAVFNAISPALKAAMPAAQKKARRQKHRRRKRPGRPHRSRARSTGS